MNHKVFLNSFLKMSQNLFLRPISFRELSSAAMQPKNLSKFQTLSLTVPKPFVYHVELNRPEKLNSFNHEMFNEITDCFKTLHKDEDCRVILLSGAGRLFSAGLDLTSVATLGEKLAEHEDVARKCKVFRELIIAYQDAISAPEKCAKPVISLVHNGCIGAGTDLITSVDIRYCTEDAYFQVKEVELGMAADIGVLQRLPRIIGNTSLANELCLTGRKIGAKESLEAGLVSKVFKDKESMMASGLELAESLSLKSPVAVQMTKRSILYSRDHGVEAGLQHIADWNQVMLQSEDFMNAAMALATKSPPPTFSKL
ncbi:delta(3,5)-Delta(2,4)-dienoyl-CoA isomerase, mitochondrial isoform X2 [Halyomorpha halys]|uniref:delta(3,5)-Delta(2,4)-dienoyl-CoA isomerase, mitochondrial isoform X2 n=1 Tax=Halyomorpha halys TaxID=286706 RepID=UPI0034D15EEB